MDSQNQSSTDAMADIQAKIDAGLAIDPDSLRNARPPGVLRRLASGVYDLMLLAGVLFIAGAVFTLPASGLLGADLTQGLAQTLFQLYLAGVCALYFGYFWSHGRQSLSMRVWRLRLVRDDGQPLSWVDALRRLLIMLPCLAPAGIGLWWAWFDRDGLGWHDKLSHTRLVLLVKPPRRRRSGSNAKTGLG